MATFERVILWWVSISMAACALFLGFKACSVPKNSHPQIEKQILPKFKAGDIVSHKLTGQKGMVIKPEIGYDQVYWYVRWNPSEKPILMSEIEIVLEK